MVKIKTKIPKKNGSLIKIFRIVKGEKQKKKDQTKKEEGKSSLNSSKKKVLIKKKKYKPEDRRFILVGLYDLLEQINEQFRLPAHFLFSTIALFDIYLQKSKKHLSRKKMRMAIYACLSILDKLENLGVFTQDFFKKFFNYKLEYEILEVVDLELYPEKEYDHFNKFYNKLKQNQNQNQNFYIYLKKFKKYFLNYNFLFLLNKEFNTNIDTNFIYCILFTLEMIREEKMPLEDANFLESCIFNMNYNFSINFYRYNYFKSLINESLRIFNEIYNKCKYK